MPFFFLVDVGYVIISASTKMRTYCLFAAFAGALPINDASAAYGTIGHELLLHHAQGGSYGHPIIG